MPPKRAGDTQNGPTSNGDEFTRAVKKRLSSSTRTGQACDRCKVRKIRCDGLPGGCSPCIQNRMECKTTDRISQKAVPRGHLEALEKRVTELETRNKELQAQLATLELERNNPGYLSLSAPDWQASGSRLRPVPPTDRLRVADRAPTSHLDPYAAANGNADCATKPPGFRAASSATYHLGMSDSYFGPFKSIALSLLGIDIDLSVLDPSEPSSASGALQMDETRRSCLATMFNVNPGYSKAELPPKDEGKRLFDYYFMISHPYLPILHRPTFMELVERMYSDSSYEPSPAQIVQAHMVLAIVHYQNGAIDRLKHLGQPSPTTSQFFDRSHVHYHHAISLMYELISFPSVEALQGIGLIVQHLRALPKPGGSWLLARMAISMCIDLGLHRTPKKWAYESGKQNLIEFEIRKRVFWSILTIEVSLASKLGKPMSLRVDEFDVEYPERVEDEFITETQLRKRPDVNEECSFDVAIELFKYITLTIQIHTTLYGASKPSRDKYVSVVEDLEGQLNKWRDSHHPSLSLESQKPERRFQAAHLESWFHEGRILMRHPSLSLSPSPSFTKDCISICVESSRAILKLTDNLRKGNHYLDTTWYGATVQLLATLTILFSVWDKRDTVTPEELGAVREDMELCMDIMSDLGALLGSPNRLREVVQLLAHGTMEMLNPKAKANRGGAATSLSSFPNPSASYSVPTSTPPIPSLRVPTTVASGVPSYPSDSSFPDVRPNNPSIPPYEPLAVQNDTSYDTPTSTALYPPSFSPSAPPPSHFPQSGDTSVSVFPWGWTGNESWRQYISTIAGELDPQETYSASALIALNQDCNNGYIQNNSPSRPAASVADPLVQTSNGSDHPVPNGFAQPQEPRAAPPWPLAIPGYQYPTDPSLSNVQKQETV